MKKVISLILAFAMMLTLSVCCLAADETTTRIRHLDDGAVADAFKQFSRMIDAESEARYTAAGDAMFELYSVISEAFITDYVSLSYQMKAYAEDNGSEFAPVFTDMNSVQDILRKFTVEGGFDSNKVQREIESSDSLDSLVALYTGAYIITRTTLGDEIKGKNGDDDAGKNGDSVMVENPKTGDSSLGTIIACSVLAVSGATAAVIFTKKKKS